MSDDEDAPRPVKKNQQEHTTPAPASRQASKRRRISRINQKETDSDADVTESEGRLISSSLFWAFFDLADIK